MLRRRRVAPPRTVRELHYRRFVGLAASGSIAMRGCNSFGGRCVELKALPKNRVCRRRLRNSGWASQRPWVGTLDDVWLPREPRVTCQ